MIMFSGSARSSNRIRISSNNSSLVRSSMTTFFRFILLFSFLPAVAAAQQTPSSTAEPKTSDSKSSQSKSPQASPRKLDRAAAYYHYTVAHMYEEQITVSARIDLANKSLAESRQAIDADPSYELLTSRLA